MVNSQGVSMRLSVVVPMYNVENYVERCLRSLLEQTYQDMEVILVNDGSTDNGPAIVEKLCAEYPKLTMLNKENGGLSDARNYGIPYTKGDYIAFLDSDDYVEPEYYEKMMAKIEEGYDVVVCDILYDFENDPSRNYVMKGLCPWPISDIRKKALLSPMFAWNKVYKAEYFREKGYRYPLNLWYEDIPVTTPIFALTERIGYVEEALIHYTQREGSIMSVTKSKRLYEIFTIMELVRKEFTELGLYEQFHDELEYLHIEHLRLYGMFRFIRSHDREGLYAQSDKVMKEFFPNWKNNPYLANLGIKNRVFLKWYSPLTKGLFHMFIR